jgi:hypothetical protein
MYGTVAGIKVCAGAIPRRGRNSLSGFPSTGVGVRELSPAFKKAILPVGFAAVALAYTVMGSGCAVAGAGASSMYS